ncbi:MAG: hydantoinase/oxoprolinase family protein [Solirubrobacteraceae bacterium]|nr:hydantoinase/oxoprolinase family protein [Solirubrobacteraceae bacterium]
MSTPEYTISVDTGGTFTDLVLADQNEVIGLFKSSTTPDDLFLGITGAIEKAAEHVGLSVADLLAASKVFVYSTTRSTNAILTGNVAKTAFITTRGNRDILLYREGGKDQPHNLALPFKTPYVPRRLCFEITERVLADGSVAVELDEAAARKTIERIGELEVEAIGVCLLWSILNPEHELRIGELIEEILPGVAYSLSHKVNRIVREYRRASSTVIDASIKPLMRDHLNDLESRLRGLGFAGEPLMVTHVSGGVMRTEQMCERPIQTVDSGPALAPVAGVVYAAAEPDAKAPDVLVADTGGTSFDVSIAHKGDILYTREKWLGPKWYGHMTGLPAVDTQSIGAGGGSIAKVDAGGLLHVGPESAGADPGPVAYGKGGTEPTVTDAAVVLGYIDPDNFLGGAMKLDREAARSAMLEKVGEPLGLSAEGAAEAILRVASEAMRGFITDMTVAQGRDPRQCIMIAGGGAAGLNIVRIARDLGVKQIIIPRLAAGLSATGGQFSDTSATFSIGQYASTSSFDYDKVNGTLNELKATLTEFLDNVKQDGERTMRFVCEARYDQQIWEIDVDLGEGREFKSEEDVKWLMERFDEAHLNLFAVNQPDFPVEIVTWRGEGRIIRPKPALTSIDPDAPVTATVEAEVSTRTGWFGGEPMDTEIHRVEDASALTQIEGPAIIEEPTTTIVLDPGSVAIVRPTHYLVEIAGAEDAAVAAGSVGAEA